MTKKTVRPEIWLFHRSKLLPHWNKKLPIFIFYLIVKEENSESKWPLNINPCTCPNPKSLFLNSRQNLSIVLRIHFGYYQSHSKYSADNYEIGRLFYGIFSSNRIHVFCKRSVDLWFYLKVVYQSFQFSDGQAIVFIFIWLQVFLRKNFKFLIFYKKMIF